MSPTFSSSRSSFIALSLSSTPFLGLWKRYSFFRLRQVTFFKWQNWAKMPTSFKHCDSWASLFSCQFLVNLSFNLHTYLTPDESVQTEKSSFFHSLKFWHPRLQKKSMISKKTLFWSVSSWVKLHDPLSYTTFIMADPARNLVRAAWKRGEKGQRRVASLVVYNTSMATSTENGESIRQFKQFKCDSSYGKLYSRHFSTWTKTWGVEKLRT